MLLYMGLSRSCDKSILLREKWPYRRLRDASGSRVGMARFLACGCRHCFSEYVAEITSWIIWRNKRAHGESTFVKEVYCYMQARIGKPAPDFETGAFVAGEFKKVKLSNYRGKWVVLCFYPGDFTFV